MAPTAASSALWRILLYALLLWLGLMLLVLINYELLLSSDASLNGEKLKPLFRPKRTEKAPISVGQAAPKSALEPAYGGNRHLKLTEELFAVGASNPQLLLRRLAEEDPLGVRGGPDAFVCPRRPEDRLDYPDIVNHSRALRFRQGAPGTWVLYQHLRKAGGTGFCDLAKLNLPSGAVPRYYCMPDNRGSLGMAPWSNGTYTQEVISRRGFRVAANEWDAFFAYMLDWEGAVLATTFRHPVERYFSQYRFEHLEHRDGTAADAKRLDMKTWYLSQRGWTMGSNYYVKTFAGYADVAPAAARGDFYWVRRS